MNEIQLWMRDFNDGSRVNIILPPISIDGATMTIRKFAKEPMTLAWLCERGSIFGRNCEVLKILVRGAITFLSRGTGSGRPTLLLMECQIVFER